MKIENIFHWSSPLSNFSRACFWSELLSSHSFMIEPITSFCYKADRLEISLLLDFLNCSAIFSDALLSVLLKSVFLYLYMWTWWFFFALLKALWGRVCNKHEAADGIHHPFHARFLTKLTHIFEIPPAGVWRVSLSSLLMPARSSRCVMFRTSAVTAFSIASAHHAFGLRS